MRDGVVIVNTARGAVLDEGALVKALDSGKVASAGLDVYEDEPNIHPGLAANRHVLLLPHMGTWTVEVSLKCSFVAIWCIGVMRFTLRAVAQYVVQDVRGVVSNAQGCNAAAVLYAADKGCRNTDEGRERPLARRAFLLILEDVFSSLLPKKEPRMTTFLLTFEDRRKQPWKKRRFQMCGPHWKRVFCWMLLQNMLSLR
jgi:hypothetical protein